MRIEASTPARVERLLALFEFDVAVFPAHRLLHVDRGEGVVQFGMVDNGLEKFDSEKRHDDRSPLPLSSFFTFVQRRLSTLLDSKSAS